MDIAVRSSLVGFFLAVKRRDGEATLRAFSASAVVEINARRGV